MLSMRLSNKAVAPTAAAAAMPAGEPKTPSSMSESELKEELESIDAELFDAIEAEDQTTLSAVRTRREALQTALANVVRDREIAARVVAKRKAAEEEKARLDRIAKLERETVQTRADLVTASAALEAQGRLFAREFAEFSAVRRAYREHQQVLRNAGAPEDEHLIAVTRLKPSFVRAAENLAVATEELDNFRHWLGDAKTIEAAQERHNREAIDAAKIGLLVASVENPHPHTQAGRNKATETERQSRSRSRMISQEVVR